jgi:hypothetical protein
MPSFRCYGLDHSGRIIMAENVEASTADEAVDLGWRFVAERQTDSLRQDLNMGLEVWQGGNLIFTTLNRPGQRPVAHQQLPSPPAPMSSGRQRSIVIGA